MKKTYTIGKRLLAMLLCLCMVVAYLPKMALFTAAAGADARYVDTSTMNDWQKIFLQPKNQGVVLDTENAGGVWTDKSVFAANAIPDELKNAVSLENTRLSITDTGDNFLVALSAIASNKEIVGYSTIPTDTVFVLDLSSSMRSNDARGGSAIDELVAATNKAITDVLELNKNNRVAVVLYAGNTSGQFNENPGATTVILPLDTYDAPADRNGVCTYLESTQGPDEYGRQQNDYAVKVAANVKNSDGRTVTQTKMNTARGTFMQDGVYEAMRVFRDVEDTKIRSGVQAGTTRLPIMVLMTDGEPTMASSDYNGNAAGTDLGESDVYLRFNNQDYNHRDTIAFLSQLTAAYAKREISQHYENNALVYTLAFGEEVNRLEEALSVMDPENTSDTLNGFWNTFLAGNQVTVFTTQSGREYSYLYARNDTAEPLSAADKLYVDEFFPATSIAELNQAFQDIVDEIIIQSKYYPTYVEKDHNHDGYITFTDKIGGYMDVKTIKGFVIGDHYFSGATLSKGFMPGNNIFGTIDEPNDYGDNLVWSVKERLGISSTAIAQSLLQAAFDEGQLSYTSDTDFSNYIGWYADANGNYLDFWFEGADVSKAPAAATHIVKSYGFLGQTDAVHGISNTDMLYASVRVSKELKDYDNDGIAGETMLLWQVPASLIPAITYEVSVDVDAQGNITGVQSVELENANVKPIRLLYEIGLQDGIHDWNVEEKVGSGYVTSTTNKDAGYVFYTNQWKKGDTTADAMSTERNTYSHFEPSVQNERYYYTENTLIYTDQNGTVYTGGAPATNGVYYRAFRVFEKLSNGSYDMDTHYERISAAALADAVQVNGQWYIPKGEVHRYLDDYSALKTLNDTNTLRYSNYPSVVSGENTYYAYSTLGNNGKLIYTPATGIKLTKTLAAGYTTNEVFTFTISGGDLDNAQVVRLDDQGDELSRTALAANGQFTMTGGETVYIVGLEADTYTVTERTDGKDYKITQVRVDNVGVSGTQADIALTAEDITDVEFTNDKKGYGSLIVSKDVNYPAGLVPTAAHNSKAFTVTVTFTGDITGVTAPGAVKNGNTYTLQLKDGDSVTFSNIPEGVTYSVAETDIPTGYDSTPEIRYTDGNQIIGAGETDQAHVVNAYEPAPATPSVMIQGAKYIKPVGTAWNNAEFTVKLYMVTDFSSGAVQDTGLSATLNEANQTYTIDLADMTSNPFTAAGIYYFRVVEVIPAGNDRIPNMAYDQTYGLFSVTVADADADGQLEIAAVTGYQGTPAGGDAAAGWTVTKDFTNTITEDRVYLDIQKTVVDASDQQITYTDHLADITFGLFTSYTDPDATPVYYMLTDGQGKAQLMIPVAKDELGTTGKTFYLREVAPGIANRVVGMHYDESWLYAITIIWDDTEGAVVTYAPFVNGAPDDTQATPYIPGTTVFAHTNTYRNNVVTAPITLEGTKLLNGSNDLGGRTFQFSIYNATAAFAYDPQTDLIKTVSNNGNDITFDGITFDAPGMHYLVIKEETTGLDYLTADDSEYHVTVQVEKFVDSDLVTKLRVVGEPVIVKYGAVGAVTGFTFDNTYTISGEASVIVEGTKTLTGRPLVNAEFTFEMIRINGENDKTPFPGATALQAHNLPDQDLDGTTDFRFPAMIYTAQDVGNTYYYLVTEVKGGTTVLGVDHDDAAYVVKVEVVDNGDGTLSARKTLLQANQIVFENTYTPQPVSVNLSGLKNLEGKAIADYTFQFRLTRTDSNYQPLTGAVAQLAQNDDRGIFSFEPLYFSATGNYYYLAEEVPGSLGGITYDASKFQVMITVTDDGLGNLSATTKMTKVITDDASDPVQVLQIPVSSIVFNNLYEITGAEGLQLSGKKTLNVKNGTLELDDGLFTFVIREGDKEVARTTNVGDTITFPNLEYGAEDVGNTYTYTIEEVNTAKAGVTYSQEKYTLTVTVSDRDGKVILSYTLTDSAGNPVENTQLNFTNTYEAKAAQATLEGTKELTGRDLVDGEFSFGLYDAEGKLLQTVTNADGRFRFQAISYTDVGTYTYTVREMIPEKALNNVFKGVTYDPTAYTVTVTVTDVGGQLQAVVSHSTEQLVLRNSYAPENISVSFKILKTVKVNSGEGISPEGFRFLLTDVTGTLLDTYTSDKDGMATGVLRFTDADEGRTYTYIVSELNTKVTGVTYSTAKYVLTVAITRDADGKLIAQTKLDNQQTDKLEMTFVNTYDMAETPVTGDSFSLGLILMAMAACAAGLVVLLLKKKALLD